MNESGVFKALIEPNLERMPVLEAVHVESYHGREFVVSQTIQRNVFTEFDRKLSRHLAAIRGAGFPAYTVAVRISERGGARSPKPLAATHNDSVPHALKEIAERARGDNPSAELSLRYSGPGGSGAASHPHTVDAETIASMEATLAICSHLGEAEFLQISGDFDVVIAKPAGELKPIIAHLNNGSMTMPCQTGSTITPFECPIYGFGEHASNNVQAQGYLATARHALVAAKENAVADFRAAAEARILSFDRALAGRRLEGHRLMAAQALVGRLKTGLGETLSGLSEDAQITALDWSTEIAETGGRGRTGSHVVVPHPATG